MRVEDVVYHLKLLEAPEMFKLFEQQIAYLIKLIRSKGSPRTSTVRTVRTRDV